MPQFTTISPTHISGQKPAAWERFLDGHYVAIGWLEDVDLTNKSMNEIRELIREREYDNEAAAIQSFERFLSLKAGGTGLNLTAACHVLHFDRWWNPAVENQATDRAFRIGQTRNVMVHKFVCRGTVEEKIDALIGEKVALSQDVLDGGAERLVTEMNNAELMKFVSLDVAKAMAG